jgi:molecular chaperone DnaK (HSP70)
MGFNHSGTATAGVKLLMAWDDDTNQDYVKIPSVIRFDSPNEIWGVPAKDLPGAVRWFKLLLLNPSDLDEEVRASPRLQQARDALQALGMSPVKAISIFIKRMFERAVQSLKNILGPGTVDSSRFHIVFTVPAIWPEYARQSMKEAVTRAGILEKRASGQTTHEFISEPEAAALATLSDLNGLPNIGVCQATTSLSACSNFPLG